MTSDTPQPEGKMMNGIRLLACIPVDRSLVRLLPPEIAYLVPHSPASGSTLGDCMSCRARIWIGPNQRPLMRLMPTLCMVCATVPYLAEGNELLIFDVSLGRS